MWHSIEEVVGIVKIEEEAHSDTEEEQGQEKKRMGDSEAIQTHTIVPCRRNRQVSLDEEPMPPKKKIKAGGLLPCTKRKLILEEMPMPQGNKKKKKKKKKEHEEEAVSTSSLCNEVCGEILARLPTKSLSRFRCVCKSWHSMFSSHHFIELHLSRANHRNHSFLFAPDQGIRHAMNLCSLRQGCAPTPILSVVNVSYCELCLLKKPCRGLNLMFEADENFSIFVCNPCTREFMELPAGNLCIDFQNVGLGFYHKTKEYKVVRLFYRIRDLESREYSMGCEVHTLGSPCGWRPTQEPPYPVNDRQPAFVNGSLHWVIDARFHPLGSRALLAFDVGHESFGVLPLPPCSSDATECMDVVELEACLCLAMRGRSGDLLDIWMMKDYQARVWNKVYCINLKKLPSHPEYAIPLLIEDGKILVAFQERIDAPPRSHETIEIYDPITETTEHLLTVPHIVSTSMPPFFTTGVCEESLVAIGKDYDGILFSLEKHKVETNILSRLPLESILRFKCVCRSWRDLISSNYFTELHLERATKTKSPEIFLLFNARKFIPLEKFDPLVVKKMDDRLQSCHDEFEQKTTSILYPKPSKPCHGLNLIHCSGNGRSYICNPFLDKWKAFFPGTVSEAVNGTDWGQYLGLGYNQVRKEHIVVKLFYRWRRFETRTYSMGCEVSTISDVCVRYYESRSVGDPPYPVSDTPPAFVGESLYWMSEPKLCSRSTPRVVLAFDLVDEVFRVVPTPCCDSDFSRSSSDVFVVELKGLLCLVDADRIMNRMDMWVLNEGAWVREYRICLENWPSFSLKRARVIPMDARKEDGRILLYTGRELGYYDSECNTIETIFTLESAFGERYRHLCEKFVDFSVVLGVESLADCEGRRCAIQFNVRR